jgi:dihydrofolate reductase
VNTARTPRVTLILARAANGVIGAKGGLPWHLPEDLAFFKRTTMGHPIVMGRKTWESIGRPLPGRRSVVVSRDRSFPATGADVVHSLDEAIALCAGTDEIFVIGGAQLYADALPRANRLLLTEIHADFEGDTFLPAPSTEAWAETSREVHPATATRPFQFDFVDYRRR